MKTNSLYQNILNIKLKCVGRAGGMAAMVLGLVLAIPVFAGLQPVASSSTAYGKTLAQWQNTYFRWSLGNITLPIDANGNAVVGNVVFLPIPQTPGDGTPGTQNVKLGVGQAFTLPFFGFLGNSYTDGTPPDDFLPLSVYQTLQISVTLDGVTLIDGRNVMQFFSQSSFDPVIPGAAPIIWLQSVSMVHNPLTPGNHVLKLDVKNTEPGFGYIVEFHNTWNINVQPGR
ncbi:MAG: hypothetical protein JWM16_6263 [Verrucomicrobiales bacterium]|nr:hypothetical protein [Verrucomicrobiales bacterium]